MYSNENNQQTTYIALLRYTGLANKNDGKCSVY